MNESQFLAAQSPILSSERKKGDSSRIILDRMKEEEYSSRIKGESDIPLDESQLIFNPVNEEKARQEEMNELAAFQDSSKKDSRENLNRYHLHY